MSKNSKIKIIVAFFIFLMMFLIINRIITKKSNTKDVKLQTSILFEQVNKSSVAKIDKYVIYGTHLNLEGNIQIPKISGISIYSVHVIAKNLEGKEISMDCSYTYKDTILSFSTFDNINEGLCIENLSQNHYYLFLKVIFSNSEERLFSLENNSKYENITYYTMSKRNKVDLEFGKYEKSPFMKLSVTKLKELPNDVYDIAIDASHGGKDTGATYKKYKESDIVLKYTKNLKQKLEALGYKVYISRDGSESQDADLSNMYAEKGRINTLQESHSKLMISLNLNDTRTKTGGVEIYAPTQCDLSFAKSLADNIVNIAKTSYSSTKVFNKEKGVYVRNFTEYDILSYKGSALLHKYEPYEITKLTPYQYMIREVGGIATGAFVDGRNKSYGTNKYYNSNIGIESYLIKLGYIRYEKDITNIVNNENLYCNAIVEAIKGYVKIDD